MARIGFAGAIAALHCGCGTAPRDGHVVPSRSTPIPYTIVVPYELPDIKVEAARFSSTGIFSHWELEWHCSFDTGGCDEELLGLTDGAGSSDYWKVTRNVVLPASITGGTGHWVRTGLATPKWRAQVRMFTARLRTNDYSRVATFPKGTAADSCIANEFTQRSGGSVYLNCATDTFIANVYANAD